MFMNNNGPIAHKPLTIQIDVPSEEASESSVAAVNWMAVIAATINLVMALRSGDAMRIAAALQALIAAITG